MSMPRFGLRRRGRANTQRTLGCHRGIAACTWYRVAVVRALVQVLYKLRGAIFFGGRGDTRARATENLFKPLLLPPWFASCLVDYLETEIQNAMLSMSEEEQTVTRVRGLKPNVKFKVEKE
jgi:hypothetical protein